jgi:hypothetical protein
VQAVQGARRRAEGERGCQRLADLGLTGICFWFVCTVLLKWMRRTWIKLNGNPSFSSASSVPCQHCSFIVLLFYYCMCLRYLCQARVTSPRLAPKKPCQAAHPPAPAPAMRATPRYSVKQD